MKEKVNENQKENKKYEYTILKIHKYINTANFNKPPLETIKITSYNIIKDIDNIEYFDGLKLNRELNEDKLLLRYENEVTEEENNIRNKENYKKTINI